MEKPEHSATAPIVGMRMTDRATAERDGLKILGQSDDKTVIVAAYQEGTQA
ncbi:hypothetical protein [Nakamurella flava]|uniref:hypothetical protein n=1 Tax=Nakamurella flava TaxID=2576308 RepID=UPI00140C4345|nr:hypothetical protein [Nakamurella flava]